MGVRRRPARSALSGCCSGFRCIETREFTARAEGSTGATVGDEPTAAVRVPWLSLFGHRQTWAFIVGKLMADPVWWFYLYWLPKFLDTKYNVKLAQVAAPIIVVYLIADVGSVGGGWISGALIKRGWTVNRARKTTMLAAALLIVPTALVSRAPSMWAAVIIVGVAAAAHQRVVGEHVYAGERHVPQIRHGIGGWHRRVRGRDGRRRLSARHRARSPGERE